MPKVSVIVPVYNTIKYLQKCLDSLMNQTIQDIQIVAIDDGSTDGSAEILDEYQKQYGEKIVIRHKKNGGQASARNMALGLCTGDYIGFLDSDDFVDSNMFEELYTKAFSERADYVGCYYRDLLDCGEKTIVLQSNVGNKTCSNNREMYLHGAKVSPFINFYKRELIIDNGILFTEGLIYEDTAFWAKIVPYIKKPAYIEKSLANRVRHSNSTTTITKPEKVRNIFPVIEDIASFYKEKGIWEEYKNEITYFCSRVLLCSSVERISRVSSKKSRKELVEETYEVLKRLFPDYKINPYLQQKGLVNKYIRFSNKVISHFVIFVYRVTKKNKV